MDFIFFWFEFKLYYIAHTQRKLFIIQRKPESHGTINLLMHDNKERREIFRAMS